MVLWPHQEGDPTVAPACQPLHHTIEATEVLGQDAIQAHMRQIVVDEDSRAAKILESLYARFIDCPDHQQRLGVAIMRQAPYRRLVQMGVMQRDVEVAALALRA